MLKLLSMEKMTLIPNPQEILWSDEPFPRYIKNHYRIYKRIFVSRCIILFIINVQHLCGSNTHQYYTDRPSVCFVFPISDNDDNDYD